MIAMSATFCKAAAGLFLSVGLLFPGGALAETGKDQVRKIEWGIWIDDDGCMHWWADGGREGYMLDRIDPKTGRAVCLKRDVCLSEPADQLFDAGSATLTDAAQSRLNDFFARTEAFGYAVYSHADSEGSAKDNLELTKARAAAVAEAGRSAGRTIERVVGLGEKVPAAASSTADGRKMNNRVEVVCYRW